MDRRQEKTVSEKLRNKLTAASIATGVGIAALTGCAPSAEAKPSPSETSTTIETPDAVETEAPTPEKTAPTTPEAEPSGIIVNYDSFANWDQKEENFNPVFTLDNPNTKEYACEQLFVENGLEPIERGELAALNLEGAGITAYMQPRIDMAFNLYKDKTNPDNQDVALKLVECLTVDRLETEGAQTFNARTRIEGAFKTWSDLSNPPENGSPFINGTVNHITRQSAGTWLNQAGGYDEYSVEYNSTDILGDTAFPIIRYEWSDVNAWKMLGIYNTISSQDEVIMWGKDDAPIVLDESRANAPYDLEL